MNVHFIAIGGAAMHNLALALHNKGYQVTGSDDTIFEPSLTVYYDYDQADENALFYAASIGHSIELNDALSLSVGALVSYNDESDYAVGNYSDWHNYELSVGADYALTDQISLSPSFLFSEGISDEAKEITESEMMAGVAVTLTF